MRLILSNDGYIYINLLFLRLSAIQMQYEPIKQPAHSYSPYQQNAPNEPKRNNSSLSDM